MSDRFWMPWIDVDPSDSLITSDSAALPASPKAYDLPSSYITMWGIFLGVSHSLYERP